MGKLYFQLHVHSDRSHDSSTSMEEFVSHFETFLGDGSHGVIAFTDHNVVPLSVKQALALSTKQVLVLPGIQWKLRKTYRDAVSKLCTRREIITVGNHDGLKAFLAEKNYRTNKHNEILGNVTEQEFLEYLSKQKEMILIVPHPKHFFFDYYGPKQIRTLKEKMAAKQIQTPFFVEEKTGYDPFPRLLHSYAGEYQIVYASDAHEITSFLGMQSFLAAEMFLNDVESIQWDEMVAHKNIAGFKTAMAEIFSILQSRNSEMVLRKHYLPSVVHFLHSVPAWVRRRFSDFPRNFLR